MENSAFIRYNQDFTLFGFQHLMMLGFMLLISFMLPFGAKYFLSPSKRLLLNRIMVVFISFWALAYVVIRLWLGDFNYKEDLPLDICNITALMLPFLMWTPSYKVHEVLYFWILAGTLQAIITPHLFNGFPNYIFFKYWIVHGGLVVYAVYVTVAFGFEPRLRSIWKAFVALQLYVIVVFGINLLLDSNYVYILRKPPTASALDYLGPWPWYILVGELVAVVLFFVFYAPFGVHKLRQKAEIH